MERNRINSRYILSCLLPIILVFMSLWSCILGSPPISIIFKIFFISQKEKTLIRIHNLAKELRCKQLRMIAKHELLLNTSAHQCSTTDVFIREIYLQITIEILNTVIILSPNNRAHRQILFLFYNLLNRLMLNMTMNCHSFIIGSFIIDSFLDKFNDCLSFIFFLLENI